MKKILVPTDFSFAAKGAGYFAMHIAREMKANVQLCNAIVVPVEAPSVAHVTPPLIAVNALEEAAIAELKRSAREIEGLVEFETGLGDYHPVVEYVTGIGTVPEVVSNLANQHDVCLVVMGMSGAGGLNEIILGSSSRTIVEKANYPVLLIPKDSQFKCLHKIAFATDLSREDVVAIHVLAGFARVFNAQLLIVHIKDKNEKMTTQHQLDIERFLNDVTNKVNYHKIYYQYVLDKDIDEGLDWLATYGQIQMLAMVHRKHSLIHNLLKGSHTQRIKRHIGIPLMVFPPECSNWVI